MAKKVTVNGKETELPNLEYEVQIQHRGEAGLSHAEGKAIRNMRGDVYSGVETVRLPKKSGSGSILRITRADTFAEDIRRNLEKTGRIPDQVQIKVTSIKRVDQGTAKLEEAGRKYKELESRYCQSERTNKTLREQLGGLGSDQKSLTELVSIRSELKLTSEDLAAKTEEAGALKQRLQQPPVITDPREAIFAFFRSREYSPRKFVDANDSYYAAQVLSGKLEDKFSNYLQTRQTELKLSPAEIEAALKLDASKTKEQIDQDEAKLKKVKNDINFYENAIIGRFGEAFIVPDTVKASLTAEYIEKESDYKTQEKEITSKLEKNRRLLEAKPKLDTEQKTYAMLRSKIAELREKSCTMPMLVTGTPESLTFSVPVRNDKAPADFVRCLGDYIAKQFPKGLKIEAIDKTQEFVSYEVLEGLKPKQRCEIIEKITQEVSPLLRSWGISGFDTYRFRV